MSPRRPVNTRTSDEPKLSFGLTKPDQYGRVAIYTSAHVHLYSPTVGPEMSFVRSDSRGIVAVIDKIPEITTKVVDAVSRYAIDPFGPHIAIRVAESDIPKYGSKIVFYVQDDVSIEEVYNALSDAMYTHVNFISTTYIQGERPSASELRARFAPGFPFDYSIV